jgi:hypothetical protein
MVRQIGKFSAQFPWLVILITIGITAFMMDQIKTNLRVEPDMTKFLPNSMPTTKGNDYYKKNFNHQDSMILGIESVDGNVMTPQTLRIIETITDQIKDLKVSKTFNSQLTAKEETLQFSLGIDTADIMSIVTLEDAILDKATGSVETGSVVKKLKRDLGLSMTDENETRLPESDRELKQLIPRLQDHILADKTFSVALLSKDLKATTVQIPMVRKWDYKRKYAVDELSIAMDAQKLKQRFQGDTSSFAFSVYNKRFGLTTYDDAFIKKHTQTVANELGDYLNDVADPVLDEIPELKALLQQPMTPDVLQQVLHYFDQREFNLHPKMVTWENFTNGIFEFMLDKIDPLSRENLEFKLLNVRDIYDLNLVYQETNNILDQYRDQDLKFYIAGAPVVTAVFSHMIAKDMGLLLPIGVVIIFIILLFSFRSVRGVAIPLITVIMSMIWALGSMAITGVPVTAMTSILPIVLLAVGSAYGIHLLNRYYEDVRESTDKRKVVALTVEHVGIAILMAGITTFVGFMSLTSSDLSMIQHFGLFAAAGVAYALVLTITFSPAMLTYWPIPRHIKRMNTTGEAFKRSLLDKFLTQKAIIVTRHPRKILTIFVAVILGSAMILPQLEFEGGQMSNFKEDSPLKQSDHFINRYLTGTGQVNLLFKFRDEVNLDNLWIKEQLSERSIAFIKQWQNFRQIHQFNSSSLSRFIDDYQQTLLAQEFGSLQPKLTTVRNIFNEEYTAEVDAPETTTDDNSLNELDALNDLDSGNSTDSLDELSMLASDEKETTSTNNEFSGLSSEQVAGLKQLSAELDGNTDNWKQTGHQIVTLRHSLSSNSGIKLQRSLNELTDLFETNIKQPQVLKQLEQFQAFAEGLESPKVNLFGKELNPTGFVSSPIDLIRTFYMVFYHDENPQYDRLPNTQTDPIADKTLTDRSVIGVVLNQAQSGNRDVFDSMISSDLKEFQLSILGRSESSNFVTEYQKYLMDESARIFTKDDPYIEKVSLAGYAPSVTELMDLISTSQMKSIALAFVFVFIVTFFIFNSALGGLYSILPLVLTVLANFAMMWLLGWKINTGTMLVASISIGIGVDYTIHFLERFKIQLRNGDNYTEAYVNTVATSGKAIIINALSVSFGFLVLLASDFVSNNAMGILMAGTMVYSALGALIMLPAIIIIFRPRFFEKHARKAV